MRKFTLLIASLFITVGAMAQITDAAQLSNEKCYHITSKDADRGAFYATAEAEYLSHCGASQAYASSYGYFNADIAKDANDENQQFAIISKGDKYYLYSVSAKKFAKKDGNYIKLVDDPSDYVTVVKNGDYFNIKINGANKLNFSGGYTYGVYANYETDDNGNNLVITEAASFDPSEALAHFAEDDVVFNWTTSTSWTDVAVENYTSSVFNDNALNNGIKCIEGSVEVGGARNATVTFNYTSGSCALNVRGVEVVDADGNIVAGDYHVGKAGSPSTNNSYTVAVAEAGTYKVRCYATFGSNDRADATNGTITISFAKANVADFSHDVTFAAEYATLHLGYKVAIPAGVQAYIVSEVGDWAILSPVTDVIPAATPVILKNVGSESTYTFAYTENSANTDVTANLLEGSIADRYVAEDAYVLGIADEEVGLYTATKNQLTETAFKNNANKAYLPKTAGMNAASYSFRFGEGTTGIENVVTENGAKAIFDLTGHRVEAISAPGIYIVNGKKVLVK